MPRENKQKTLETKIRARALYETGKYTLQEIYNAVGTTNKTLDKWIHEDPNDIWQKGGVVNEVYDIEKIAHKNKILRNFKKDEEKIKEDVLTHKAKEDAIKEAQVIINIAEARNKLAKETLESLNKTKQYIDELIAKGKTATIIEEDIVFNGKKIEGATKTTKKGEHHKIAELTKAFEAYTKVLQGVGFLQQHQHFTQNNIKIEKDSDVQDNNETPNSILRLYKTIEQHRDSIENEQKQIKEVNK